MSFGIGDPDIPTPQSVVDELRLTALDAPNHRYPETDGLPEFRRAISESPLHSNLPRSSRPADS